MSAITIAPSAIPTPEGAVIRTKPFGETVTAGMPVYLHSDGKVYKTDVDGTAAQKACYGIAMNGGILDEDCDVLISATGPVTLTASGITVGSPYYAGSAASGSIVPFGDLDGSDVVIYLGTGYSATQIMYKLHVTGVTHA